ncbi:MAG: Crp/Fnr family transcriptional regulator [Candidatus Marinimicrobia bacterium]|nr:Crp/Fnr family transcriptional regulator [Candidatus Neomarinimicrobiota bacterium]MCF7904191.1 Crp/Fnr family transcriptional regulator [Candidatus Neomarinimicrobiota bacterium]
MRQESPLKKESISVESCSYDHRLNILHGLPFYSMLDHHSLQAINSSYSEHGYQPGETIYLSGKKSTRFYVIAIGKVKLLEHTSSGHNVLLDILGPGEFLGGSWTEDQTTHFHSETAIALTQCCILEIDRSDFKDIASKHAAVAMKFLEILESRMRMLQTRVKMQATASVERRLAFTIYKFADKLGKPTKNGVLIQFPFSRADLAEFSGTTPETASRIVSQFKKKGLLETGRQWMTVKDVLRLSAIAEIDE